MLKNKPALGQGIYTPPEISSILKVPQYQIRWYIEAVWDNRFGKQFDATYSWKLRSHRAVNFLVLVEFRVVLDLKNLGLPTRRILNARESIGRDEKAPYPFATSRLRANAERIWYEAGGNVLDADGTQQTNFRTLVENYTECIDYVDDLAARLWPDTKQSSVVVDPHHQFGQPTIDGTNITAETIYSMYESGESLEVLGYLYQIPVKKVEDAVKFCQRKAA